MAGPPEGYVDVAERIRLFKAEFPTGTLQSYVPPFLLEVGGKAFIAYGAAAYRTPDDPRPGIGWAWEPVPGPTNFTRDSELQNAETSAWGRAIVALGFETKNIASAQEVRNRSGESAASAHPPAPSPAAGSPDFDYGKQLLPGAIGGKTAGVDLKAARENLDPTLLWESLLDTACMHVFGVGRMSIQPKDTAEFWIRYSNTVQTIRQHTEGDDFPPATEEVIQEAFGECWNGLVLGTPFPRLPLPADV